MTLAVFLLMFVGLLISLPLTAMLVRAGHRAGTLDTTGADGHDKTIREIPNIGGMAIFLAIAGPMAAGIAAVWLVDGATWQRWFPALAPHIDRLRESTPTALALLAALAVLHVTGLADDRRSLGPWLKLAVQIAAAAVLVIWFDVRLLTVIGPVGSVIVTILWIVAVTNAINFIDNMDGLAAGVTAIAAALFMAACLVNGQWFIASMLALTIGALAGFLVFNFPPARIFMGDGGSLVLGFLLGVLTARTTFLHSDLGGGWYGVCMPLVVLAIPLYDLVSVTLIRLKQGRNPFVGDQQHFSHRLVQRGLSSRGAVVVIWAATAVTGIAGVFLGGLEAWQAILVGLQTLLVLLMLALLEHASRHAAARGRAPVTGTSRRETAGMDPWSRLGVLAIVAIAAARSVIVFAPQVLFDVDPALDATRLGALGPPGSLLLDVALLLACGCALIGVARSRAAGAWVVLLALLPAPVIAWHGGADAGDLWRGSTWLAAMVAAAVVSTAATDRRLCVVALSLLLAALAPMLARGAMQLSVEHADTLAQFEHGKERFFADRGWAPDSAAARIYERRLRQAVPRGWFTTTNIYAAAMAVGLILATALALGAHRARLAGGWTAAMVLLAAACGAGLLASRSKGAIVTAGAGLTLLAAALVVKRLWRGSPVGALLCVGLALAALTGVAVRGGLLPESFAGERSVLFRWHYLVASSRLVVDAPLLGVGPDGFQQAYTLVRLPRNPEEVTSAHSMTADWLSMLGLIGLSWLALVTALLWRAGRGVCGDDGPFDDDPAETARWVARLSIITALPVFAVSIWAEWPALDQLGLTVRVLGAAGFALLAPLLAYVLASSGERCVGWAMACAAAVLVAHGQIEMTWFEPGAIVAVAVLVGLAAATAGGPPGPTERAGRRIAPICAAVVVLGLAAGLAIVGAVPAWRQHSLVAAAAAALDPISDDAVARLAQRQAAADRLYEAYRRMPTNARPAEAAVQQLMLQANEFPEGFDRQLPLQAALSSARELWMSHRRGSSLNLAVNAAVALASSTNGNWQTAIDLARTMVELDPHGLAVRRRLGDILWEAGRHDEAASAYRRVLEIDEQLELDPLKRLSERQRATIEQRTAEVGARP